MRARVYFKCPEVDGHFETRSPDSFEEFVQKVGDAATNSRGFGFFVGDFSIPLRYITRIEKLED